MMTGVGIGALTGALAVASLDRRIRKGPTLIAAGAAFGLLLVAFALSKLYLLSVGLLALTGGTMIVNNALANTTIQEIVPDQLRGRVMGFYAFVFVGLAPLGSFQIGALAERIGTPAAVALGGAATALAVALAAWRGAELPRGPARWFTQNRSPGGPPVVAAPGPPPAPRLAPPVRRS